MPTILGNIEDVPMSEYFGETNLGSMKKIAHKQQVKLASKTAPKRGLSGDEDFGGLWDSIKATATKTVSSITGKATTAGTQALTQAKTAATQAAQSTVQKAQEQVISQSTLLSNKALTSVGLQPSTPKPQPPASTPAATVSTGTNLNVLEAAKTAIAELPKPMKVGLSTAAVIGIFVGGVFLWMAMSKKGKK